MGTAILRAPDVNARGETPRVAMVGGLPAWERRVALGIFRPWRIPTRGPPVGATVEHREGSSLTNTSHAKLGLGAPRGDTSGQWERDREDRDV